MARIQELTLNRGNRGLLILALAAGLITAILVFVALADSGEKTGTTSSPAAVTSRAAVAAQAITAGTEITAEMVEVKEIPDTLLVAGAFADAAPAVGEVARYPIAKGEQLSSAKVGAEPKSDGLNFVVPKGKRAVAVEVQEVTNVGGLLLTGNRVDVLIAARPVNELEDDHVTVFTILRDIEVLSVAQKAQQAIPAASGETGSTDLGTSCQLPDELEQQPGAATVTLAVDPTQAELLACVQDHQLVERVWFSLRPFGEDAPAVQTTIPIDYCIIGQ